MFRFGLKKGNSCLFQGATSRIFGGCAICHRVQMPHCHGVIVEIRTPPHPALPGHLPLKGKAFATALYNKKAIDHSIDGFGPSGESRTHGLLNPIQARYQTALHPDVTHCDGHYYTPSNRQMSTFSFAFFYKNCKIPALRGRAGPLGMHIFEHTHRPWFTLPANPQILLCTAPQIFTTSSQALTNKKAIDLSINGFWSEWRESNSRPLEPHSSALPNCATPGCHSKRQVLL